MGKNRGDKEILIRILEIICSLFVMFSFTLTGSLFGMTGAISNLDSTGQRLVIGSVWLALAALIAVLLYFKAKQKPLLSFRILEIKDKKQLWLLPAGSVIAFVGGAAMNRLLTILMSLISFPESWVEAHDKSVESSTQGNVFVAILAVCIMAPLVEELAFRGKGFYYLRSAVGGRAGTVIAVIFTSLVFALAHGNYIQAIYAFIAGAAFSLLSLSFGSVIPSVFAHIGFNMANLLFLAFFSSEYIENMGLLLNLACALVFVMCVAACCIMGSILRGGGKVKEDTPGPSIYIN